jgi:pilus assembly protein FimV
LIAKSHRWQKTAVAAAAVALLGLSTTAALALSLGRITVQSALGEPLRAEIDVPEINAEEAASLKANTATADAFAAAGLEYNPAMSSLQATLLRRPDGRAYIRLSSDRAINDPFVDMIIEASWSSGRILRDYTMLFDPPVLRKSAPTAPTLAQINVAPTPATNTIAKTPATATTTEPPRAATPLKPAVAGKPSAPAKVPPAVQPSDANRVVVKTGDTASKIAANTKASGVSLDQMLVALIRANPDAFIHNNINRIRAGAVLDVPTAEQAKTLSTAEATQTVIAQSKDFNEFRRNLASNAPVATVGPASRKTTGAIDTKVEDKKSATVAPDKLTLSKGSIQSSAGDAKIAKERADKDAASRAAEIAKNISDLKKLGTTSVAAPPPAPAIAASQQKPASAAILAVPVTVAPAAPLKPVLPPVSATSAPTMPASTAASTPVKPKVAALPVPEPVEPPGFIDELLEDPLLPAGAGGLLALLAGFAFWRNRQNKKNQSHMDSSFLESRLQPDSFFGASGGQRVDTNNESPATGSSMVYSASQLDAADDVDPVAEADVYLAYGRDLQAEEILREAVQTNPGRLAIHTKLLEIFAKRRDAKNFEATAIQAYALTGNSSPDWTRICEMGIAFDPNNPLYQAGGSPSSLGTQPTAAVPAPDFGSTVAQSASAELGESVSGVDLDLDLDFSLDEEPASAISEPLISTPAAEQPVQASTIDLNSPLDMDFDLPDEVSAPGPTPAPEEPASAPDVSLSMDGLKLDDGGLHDLPDFDADATMPIEATGSPAPVHDSGMLEFDLGSLSLDLEPPVEKPTEAPDSIGEDPLETKLSLAEEFVSIGDEDGARALIEEVVAESTGDLRAKAQRALANLS